jgi:hypothetical protein
MHAQEQPVPLHHPNWQIQISCHHSAGQRNWTRTLKSSASLSGNRAIIIKRESIGINCAFVNNCFLPLENKNSLYQLSIIKLNDKSTIYTIPSHCRDFPARLFHQIWSLETIL